jgi:isopenicillin N synthase-like dioxygenase
MTRFTIATIDLAKCATPEALADAIKSSLSTSGFLFIQGHGLERQVEELFEISGKSSALSPRKAKLTGHSLLATLEDFFENETESEKQRAAYVSSQDMSTKSDSKAEVCELAGGQ